MLEYTRGDSGETAKPRPSVTTGMAQKKFLHVQNAYLPSRGPIAGLHYKDGRVFIRIKKNRDGLSIMQNQSINATDSFYADFLLPCHDFVFVFADGGQVLGNIVL